MPHKLQPKSHHTKERLLDAANTLFCEKGYTGVSISDIAERTGLNKALIFYYFGSKEKLYINVAERNHAQFSERLKSELSKIKDPALQLKELISNHIRIFNENLHILRIVLRELSVAPENRNFPVGKFAAPQLETLKNILDEGIEKGVFRSIDTSETATLILGLIFGLTIDQLLSPKRLDPTRLADDVFSLILEGIRK